MTWQKHVEMTEEGYLGRERFRELPTSAICTLTPMDVYAEATERKKQQTFENLSKLDIF